MKLLIDADGCPVRNISEEIAREYHIPLVIVSNIHHQIQSDYGQVITVDSGRDMADHDILKRTEKGDLVVTQDYGLASLVLMKKAYAMHQDGWFYTENNIDMLLMQRQMGQKMRQAKKHYNHIPKRKEDDDLLFKKTLTQFLEEHTRGEPL